jgi:hypothetical protein
MSRLCTCCVKENINYPVECKLCKRCRKHCTCLKERKEVLQAFNILKKFIEKKLKLDK